MKKQTSQKTPKIKKQKQKTNMKTKTRKKQTNKFFKKGCVSFFFFFMYFYPMILKFPILTASSAVPLNFHFFPAYESMVCILAIQSEKEGHAITLPALFQSSASELNDYLVLFASVSQPGKAI